jgi:hypothetical protein
MLRVSSVSAELSVAIFRVNDLGGGEAVTG